MHYPKISVVIGSYNRKDLLELCIDAVRQELQDEFYEIIVVDGGSRDGAMEWLIQQKDIITIVQHNRGMWKGKAIERKPWAYFMNLGFKSACGEYICMLSDDSLIVPGAIEEGVKLFDRKRAAGEKVGGVAFYFRDFPVRKRFSVAVNLGELYVNHGLFLRSAMAEVGFCDEEFHFYFADTDLSLKIVQAGYSIIPSPSSFVEHYFDATPDIRLSNNDERKALDRSRLIEKWKGVAYAEKQEANYRERIGFWDPHPAPEVDTSEALRALVSASSEWSDDAPGVSIVTIVKNDPEGLKRTIQSVKRQCFPFIQYIVIDGGSSHATQTVLKQEFQSIDVLISERDQGVYDAMNKGIDQVDQDYCLFLNAGDCLYEAETIGNAVKCLNARPDLLYGDRIYRYGEGHERQRREKAMPIEKIKEEMPFCHQAVFYKSTILRKFPFNSTYRYAADYEQLVRIYTAGQSFHQIDEVICEFYAGGRSESGLEPYLECLKIQFDNFGDGEHMKNSKYMKGLIKYKDKLLSGYR